IVAVDLSGHGKSQHRSADASYHFIDWVPEVLRLADALGWAEFTIVGHSMGAAIGMLTAATAPERLVALAMIEGLTPLPGDATAAPERLASYIAASARKRALPVYATVEEALA